MATLADWVNGINAQNAAKAGLDPITAQVMQNYGYLAGYLDEPEIGPILRQAAQNGWSKEILEGKLYATSWWKNHSAGARQLDLLKNTDPKEWTQQVESKIFELQQQAQAGGAYIQDYQSLKDMAITILSDPSLSPQTVQYMLFAHAEYQQNQGGTLGSTMSDIKKMAGNYMVPLSDTTAFQWSKNIAQGVATPEAAQEYMKQQAKSKYGWLADDIDRGFTTKDLFDPYIEQTAQLLETTPDQIDLTDPKWSPMIGTVDPTTGKQRAMTLSEAGEYVRRSDAYDTTTAAMNKTAQFAENIAETFGKVKTS